MAKLVLVINTSNWLQLTVSYY